MNLAPTLKWARMAAWQLAHPHSTARSQITAQRFTDKLGWLSEFAADIPRWHACQEVVDAALTFINQQGLTRGAADQLATLLHPLTPDATSRSVADQLIEFVRRSAEPLAEGQRLPLSTEILESAFGLFKQLERQHSRGGFTSLLAAFGALLKPNTPRPNAKQPTPNSKPPPPNHSQTPTPPENLVSSGQMWSVPIKEWEEELSLLDSPTSAERDL